MTERQVRIARAMMNIEPYKVSNQNLLFVEQSENQLKLDWIESTIKLKEPARESVFKQEGT